MCSRSFDSSLYRSTGQMSLGISCCQPPNRSAISVTSYNTYSVSFDGAKDAAVAAYTAKYGQPPEMKEGRGKGKGKGREEGRDGNKRRGGKGRKGRKRKEGREG